MRHKTVSTPRPAVVLAACTLGAVLLAGCGHQENAAQSPAQIKSAMGGHYTPSQLAQAQAYRQQELKTQAEMTQMMRGKSGGAAPSTRSKSNP